MKFDAVREANRIIRNVSKPFATHKEIEECFQRLRVMLKKDIEESKRRNFNSSED